MEEEKIEEIIERKVEEKLEEKIDKEESSPEPGNWIDRKIQEKFNQHQKKEAEEDEPSISRRSFLKALGIGASGLALTSTVSSASLLSGTTVGGNDVLTTADEGHNNGINADTVDGKHASQLGGSVNQDSNISKTGDLKLDNNGNLYISYPGYKTYTYYNINPNYTINLNTTMTLQKVWALAHVTGTNNIAQEFGVYPNGGSSFGRISTSVDSTSHIFQDSTVGSYPGATTVYLDERGDYLTAYTLRLYRKVTGTGTTSVTLT